MDREEGYRDGRCVCVWLCTGRGGFCMGLNCGWKIWVLCRCMGAYLVCYMVVVEGGNECMFRGCNSERLGIDCTPLGIK